MAKCTFCKKKMGMMEFTCKCDYEYCQKCLAPEVHKCTFDFKIHGKSLLKEKLTKVTNVKLVKI